MGKRSAMTIKQAKVNKQAMADSLYRANNESAQAIRYGEQANNARRAYSVTSDTTTSWRERFIVANALRAKLLPTRYDVHEIGDDCANVLFVYDQCFCLKVELREPTVGTASRMLARRGKIKLPEHALDRYTCTLSRFDCSGTHTCTKRDLPDVIAYIEMINRTYDRDLFQYIAE